MPSQHDYAGTGLTIQYAMLDQAKRFPDKNTRPKFLLWGGLRINTAGSISVPREGVVRGEFLSRKTDVEQGFDIKVEGWIQLAGGERVSLLRTWNDPRYVPTVAYPFYAKDGLLWVWNVYKMKYGGGQIVEEKWTGNAGFWVEKINEMERIYHCSPGMADPPNFDSLIFKIIVRDEP
jgi:hypothetical protein